MKLSGLHLSEYCKHRAVPLQLGDSMFQIGQLEDEVHPAVRADGIGANIHEELPQFDGIPC